MPEVTEIRANFKSSKTADSNNIHTTFLKSNFIILTPIPSNLINKSLATGLFPKLLKSSKIFQLFINKNQFNTPNYRAISLHPSSVKFIKKFVFIKDSMTICLLTKFYYHHVSLVSDRVQATNTLCWNFLMIFKNYLMRSNLQVEHSWISVKPLPVWIIIFYYPNSNDMASMLLHGNGSIVACQTDNIFVSWVWTPLPSLNQNIGVHSSCRVQFSGPYIVSDITTIR